MLQAKFNDEVEQQEHIIWESKSAICEEKSVQKEKKNDQPNTSKTLLA